MVWPDGDQERVTVGDREAVPEGDDVLPPVEDPIGVGGAEGTGTIAHPDPPPFPTPSPAGGSRVMMSSPDNPAFKHSEHRHSVTGRKAMRWA